MKVERMYPAFSERTTDAVKVFLYDRKNAKTGLANLSVSTEKFAKSLGFAGKTGQIVILPDDHGRPAQILAGLGDGTNPLAVAAISSQLRAGVYEVVVKPETWPFSWIAKGWADGAYRFDKYLSGSAEPPKLVLPDTEDHDAIMREATAMALTRNLVNTPAEDMGPDAIEAAIHELADAHGADVSSVVGDALLDANYPMIHAVGRAGHVPPRLVELSWGAEDAPELALVGKGVSFDTGGLNIKTGNYMRIMKKDMGGAAHAIGLASLVMAAKLPVRLKLYIPTVENAVGGNAFRPGDVLSTRKGLSVEIDNTDAEGRLILADALARACETKPDLLIDFATLTGAARVALGPDLAPFYTHDNALAEAIAAGARVSGDPVWRMPLWAPYISYLSSSIADIANSGSSMAGSITAALFLNDFVDVERWVHFDIWAWREARYGRPAGAATCGLWAMWSLLQKRYLE